MRNMKQTYTAAVKQDVSCWIVWIEEVPGVNCQEFSREAFITVAARNVN